MCLFRCIAVHPGVRPDRRTVELAKQFVGATSYGLRGYSTLRKPGLIRLIAEARAPVFRERSKRALKTGRYLALRGDIDNPPKKAQRIRELHQLKDEVTAALRAQKYEQDSKSNPLKRLKMHN